MKWNRKEASEPGLVFTVIFSKASLQASNICSSLQSTGVLTLTRPHKHVPKPASHAGGSPDYPSLCLSACCWCKSSPHAAHCTKIFGKAKDDVDRGHLRACSRCRTYSRQWCSVVCSSRPGMMPAKLLVPDLLSLVRRCSSLPAQAKLLCCR